VDSRPLILPCDCSSIPWLTPVSSFVNDLLARCPGIEKREAKAGIGSCISETGGLSGALIGAGIGAAIGFLFGGPLGALIGAAAGALLGYFWGFTSSVIGVIGGLVVGILGAISDFVEGLSMPLKTSSQGMELVVLAWSSPRTEERISEINSRSNAPVSSRPLQLIKLTYI
jgi:uncharacterized membrane protein